MVKQSILWLLATVVAGTSSTAFASPQQFSDPVEMFAEFNDYIQENGTLEVASTEPLHIRLIERTPPGQPSDVAVENVKRAVIYGVYRSFIHTDIEKVTVTALAGLIQAPDMRIVKVLESTAITITLTRAEALAKVRKYCDADDFGDLVYDFQMGDFTIRDEWSGCFETLMYNDTGPPGINRFFEELGHSTR